MFIHVYIYAYHCEPLNLSVPVPFIFSLHITFIQFNRYPPWLRMCVISGHRSDHNQGKFDGGAANSLVLRTKGGGGDFHRFQNLDSGILK